MHRTRISREPSHKSKLISIESTFLLLIVNVLTCNLLEFVAEHKPFGWPNDRARRVPLDCGTRSWRCHNDELVGLDESPGSHKSIATPPFSGLAFERMAATINCLSSSREAAWHGDDNRAQINESQENLAEQNNEAPILISSLQKERPQNEPKQRAALSPVTTPGGRQWRRRRQRQQPPTICCCADGRRSSWSIIQLAEAIRLIRLEAPRSARAGQPIQLRCLYETRNDKLQSLSWYRNGREFYRFQPFERRQPILAFNMSGIQVDISRSRNNTVFLVNTTSETSGRYRCEATGTTFQEANLETYVEVLPASSSSASNAGAYCANPIAIIMIITITLMGVAPQTHTNCVRDF